MSAPTRTIASLVGDKVSGKGGVEVETSSFCGSGRYVGLYFSAHWCPPCRGFTPKLAEIYDKIKKSDNQNKFEIVFISSDRSDEDFSSYFSEMPWLAVPFANRDLKNDTSKVFGVTGIPTFIILDSDTGAVVCKDGRSAVMADPEGFPWNK